MCCDSQSGEVVFGFNIRVPGVATQSDLGRNMSMFPKMSGVGGRGRGRGEGIILVFGLCVVGIRHNAIEMSCILLKVNLSRYFTCSQPRGQS